ncbi:MAG: DUF58 domain-containing protein [Lentisphaerota bacterium]
MNLILPTSRGVVFLFFTAGSVMVALVNVGLATALTASSLSGIVISSFLLAMFSLYGIEIKRVPNQDGERGRRVFMPVTLINRARRYRQSIVIREACSFVEGGRNNYPAPPLAPGEELVVNRWMFAASRGYYKMKKITLIGGDPAGLFCSKRIFTLPGAIMIYPEIVPLTWLPIKLKKREMPAVEGRLLGISGQGQEFFGVRGYRSYDEVRFIHWKASASKRRLMVKEFEANTVDEVNILLDAELSSIGIDHNDNNFEFLLKTASSITGYLAEMYCRIQFITHGPGATVIRLHGDAAGVKTKIINALAVLEPQKVPFIELLDGELEHIFANSILYCLTMSEPDNLHQRFEALMERGIEIRWIYAPKEYFPMIIEPELPRKIKKGKIKTSSSGAVTPYVATFETDVSGMLRNE